MIRFLPIIVELAILIYCLLDCAQTDATRVRNLPKLVWMLLIILVPLIGGVAWLLAGRPERRDEPGSSAWPTRGAGGPPTPRRRTAPRGPDDDPDFLRQIRLDGNQRGAGGRRPGDDARRDQGPDSDPPGPSPA